MIGYVVMKLCRWENLGLESNPPFAIKIGQPEQSPGYLMVFYNRADAVKFAGDESLVKQIVTGIGR